MNRIKVISFDLEGTLTSLDFTRAVYYEGIPSLISERDCIPIEKAQAAVHHQYEGVGAKSLDWYDIKYWFNTFKLEDYPQILEKYADRVHCYPDVVQALTTLKKDYTLIISTSANREFLPYLLKGIDGYSLRVFSSVSDYKMIKCPGFYKEICREMGVRVDEIVHVGDSWEFDILAAQKAGLKAFYLNRSGTEDTANFLSSLADLKAKLSKT